MASSEPEERELVRGTSEIVCTECHTAPRLQSLRKNSGTVVGCDCDGAKYSMDSVPYELSIHDLPDQWVVIEGRTARQMSMEVDLCIEGDIYKCPVCGDEFGITEMSNSCSNCGHIPERNRWLPEDEDEPEERDDTFDSFYGALCERPEGEDVDG